MGCSTKQKDDKTRVSHFLDRSTIQQVTGVMNVISKRGYMVGTDLILTKEEDRRWCISDLEQNILYASTLLLPVVRQFVEMETPEVITNILSSPPNRCR